MTALTAAEIAQLDQVVAHYGSSLDLLVEETGKAIAADGRTQALGRALGVCRSIVADDAEDLLVVAALALVRLAEVP